MILAIIENKMSRKMHFLYLAIGNYLVFICNQIIWLLLIIIIIIIMVIFKCYFSGELIALS